MTRIHVALLLPLLLLACSEADAPAPAAKAVPARTVAHPEVHAFFATRPELGAITAIEPQPEWAKGPRKRVRTSNGTYLAYIQGGQIVTVYSENDGGRKEIYRNDVPPAQAPKRAAAATPEPNDTVLGSR